MNILRLTISAILILCIYACDSNPENTASPNGAGLTILPSSQTGITFKNTLADDPLSDKNVLSFQHYFNGAGVGIGDFNNDGLPDIFFAGNEVPNELYINKGDMKFEKLGPESGINKNKVWAAGVSVVDINNDAYPDIYISQQGPYAPEERRNLFYINNGDLTFTESATSLGLDDVNYSTQATFFDYDKDGDLDCYVMNESKYAGIILAEVYKDLEKKENMIAASGKLFENLGNLEFKDVTEQAGVLNYGYGLGLNISDFNNDNWPDIYVANDYTVPDFLYINQKDGTFKESVKDYTRQISYFGMGCDVADINNDGLVDIGVVDMAAEDHFRDKTLMAGMDSEGFKYYFYKLGYQFQYMFNSLQINNGNNTFSNIAALAGVLKSDWSWAALFVDLNLDGYKDYYVSNGYRRYARDNDFRIRMAEIRDQNNGVVPMEYRAELYELMPEVKLKNKMYMNDGNLHFDDSQKSFSHPDYESYSYGVAYADFDQDGDFDIIINNIDQEATLLKNTARENLDHNYIKIVLDHPNIAKRLTSKVYVYAGGQMQFQEYQFVRGYESTMEECLIFGLGDWTEIDSIQVIWADNNVQTILTPAINQSLTISYEKQRDWKPAKQVQSMFDQIAGADLGIDFQHKENYYDDFEREILLPQKQSYFGPALATADVNNDGLEDVFIGGAKGQAGALYIQNSDGTFNEADLAFQPWKNEAILEDVAAVFIDPNNDGKMDLYVASGGSGDFLGEENLLQDRFYANMGDGRFGRIGNILDESFSATYNVIAANIDGDPEKELIVIGAAKPGKYPMKEATVILDYENQRYVDKTEAWVPELNTIDGLIRDCSFADIDNDGDKDLITVGEWQSINVFINEGGTWQLSPQKWVPEYKEGWYRSIESADLDGDGDLDFVVGNVGTNFKQKAKKDYPLYLFSNDYDENGTLDIVLAKPYNDKIVPTRGRQCSSEQMPFIKDKFETYKDFANAGIGDILGEDKIDKGIKLSAHSFYSLILWNEKDHFEVEKMTPLAQMAPINDILLRDINNDNLTDILIVGNDYNTEYETPRLDAGNGLVLMNKGSKSFKPLTINDSGFFNPGDAKKMTSLKTSDGLLYLVANNNDVLNIFKRNEVVQ
ncbi:MAG: VCBS repeat-containing protein [Saprospiraceae bacterium]|nr:VCBS repeat-containing protein [Saprospiraceae bacterium]